MPYSTPDSTPAELEPTEREMLIAKHAAKLAVREMQDDFYKMVGKGVVNRALTVIGLLAVLLAGWVYGSSQHLNK